MNRRAGWIGLGLLILFVSYLILVWTPPTADFDLAFTQGQMMPADQLTSTVSTQTGPASSLTFGQMFDFGPVSHAHNVVDPCLETDGCLGYPDSPKIRQMIANPTFHVFGRSVEVLGRLWWLEGRRPYLAVYLKMTFSTPTK
jgi:hypothetical protein